jgi:hypothetical protein
MKLFDVTTEVIDGPSLMNGDSYEYYHKSTRHDMGIIRITLEKWFSAYPEEEKFDLKSRFTKDFDSAFYELFLYSLFIKLGFSIIIHPQLENSTKKPDFLISKNRLQVYVEAKIYYGKSDKEMAFDRLENEFYDQLNKVRIKGFLLKIKKLEFKATKQPRVKELINKIEKEAVKHDPTLVALNVKNHEFSERPIIKFENQYLKITILLIPLDELHNSKVSNTPIGGFPSKAFWGGSEESLRSSVLKKANRYGKFQIPYIVCVNALSIKTSGKEDVDNAIWGSLQYTYSIDFTELETVTRANDGLFNNYNKSKLANVSGILVTKVFPSNIPNANYWLYKNPFARNSFDFEQLRLVYNQVIGNQITSLEGNNLDEVFEIPKSWLSE